MSAIVVPVDFFPTEAKDSWRLQQDLRLLGWLFLFSLLVHLLLLWRMKGEGMYSAAAVPATTVPIKIRLQVQPSDSQHIRTVSHIRPAPVQSAPLPTQESVAAPTHDAGADVSEQATVSSKLAPAVSKVNQAEQDESYLKHVRALIESHKFYPGSARRLGMQGTVQVSFVINPDGSVSQVVSSGGARLLRLAAEQALRSATPFPAQQSSAARPLQIHYETTFALN